jgi:hypothetical protein
MADAAVTDSAIKETKTVIKSFLPVLWFAGFNGSVGPSQLTRIISSGVVCASGAILSGVSSSFALELQYIRQKISRELLSALTSCSGPI